MRTVALTTVLTSMFFVHLDHSRSGGAERAATADDAANASPVPASVAIEAPLEPDVGEPPALRFPLPDPPAFDDSFGDPRPGGRRHEGVDIIAAKRTPVHAAAAGTVRWLHDEAGGRCCALALLHPNGWRTRYLHLDNDTPGTDDGLAVGLAPGLAPGAFVEAGELIGWVGDSGNAEEVGAHLHFELRDPQGVAVNATELLRAAVERRRHELAAEESPAAQ
jgi:murein DD-endopeptidase MepM/ murein hydrolase activator NlpD